MQRRYLLSIDGGGIRGILPATLLEKLERTTGRPVRETFAFAAGTSTGAILVTALAAGLPASRLVDLYLKRGKEIFSPRAPWNTIKRVATGSMYSTQKLHDILAEEFGAAKDWTLNDSPIDLLVTAKALADGMPWYLVKDKPANARTTGKLRLVDSATASAAAPTYFSPWKLPGAGVLVDGGVGVTGNPVYQACVEAFYYTGEYKPEETVVVSLGTGRFLTDHDPHGLWGWLQWILDELLRSPGEQQTQIVHRHFPLASFHRLDPDIRKIDPSLDHAIDMDDVEAVEQLHGYGKQFAESVDWEAILEGRDTRFLVTDKTTLWPQYSTPR